MASIPFAATTAPAIRANAEAVARWLFAVAALVFVMVVVGGITRLTESGLSITRWNLVGGTLPPLNAAAWQTAFDEYRATSEYRMVNAGMSLADFRAIFWWEWGHRLLGRLIGLAYAVPLAWYWLRGMIPAGYKPRLLVLLVLGAAQGAIGWWMVASGLIDRVDVAHERLAVHLGMALILFAALLWTALDLRGAPAAAAPRPRRWVAPFLALLAGQITLGAFTAGMRAGRVSDDWPGMGDWFMTDELTTLAPWWQNLIDNPVAVQFAHRTLAYAVAAAAMLIAWRLWRAGAGWRAGALAGAIGAQFALGVATVLSGVAIGVASLHQAGGVALLAATVVAAHWARRPVARVATGR